jgi:hypothetical protein
MARAWGLILLGLCLILAGSAQADAPPPLPAGTGLSEAEAERMIREGRLKGDDLIKAGDKISWWTKMQLYGYAMELDPYFEGVEEAIRQLARADGRDGRTVALRQEELSRMLHRARARVMESGRQEPETDWRRGLLGLIYLDQEWRKRVYEKQKNEIKNPYDLVDLMDCLDAEIRGIKESAAKGCPLRMHNPAYRQEDAAHE